MGTSEIIGLAAPIIGNFGYKAPQQDLVLLKYDQQQQKNKTAIYLAILAAAVLFGLGMMLYFK